MIKGSNPGTGNWINIFIFICYTVSTVWKDQSQTKKKAIFKNQDKGGLEVHFFVLPKYLIDALSKISVID